jgi:DNA-binding IclR family transcriptional regulator
METPVSLPSELRAFLHACIDGIEQIDILLLLRGSDRGWTTREVAAAIRASEPATRMHLQTLTARGLLDAKPGTEVLYRYQPRTAALRGYVDLLVEHYVRSRSDVITFVARQARQGIKSFSDAFKLKKPD